MEWSYDLYGSKPIYRDIPIYDDSTTVDGSLYCAGATTNNAIAILATAPYENVVGLLLEGGLTASGTVALGTMSYGKMVINPGAVFQARYSLTGDTSNACAAVASGSSTTNFKVSTSDDHMDGSFIYICAGTGIGGLWYCDEATTTDLSTLSTMTEAPDATSYLQFIKGGFGVQDTVTAALAGGKDLDAEATMLISDENETGLFALLQRWIQTSGMEKQELRRATHDGLTGLNSANVRFYHDIHPLQHIYGSGTSNN